jgi:hypothetical protein
VGTRLLCCSSGNVTDDVIARYIAEQNVDQDEDFKFTEHRLHDVQPGAVSWREDKLESVRVKTEPALRLF